MSSYQSISPTSLNDSHRERDWRLNSTHLQDRDNDSTSITNSSAFKTSPVLLIGLAIGFIAGFFFSDSTFSSQRNMSMHRITSSTWLDNKSFIDLVHAKFPIEKEENYIEEPYDLSLTSNPPNDLVYFDNITAITMLLKSSTLNTHYFLYETGLEAQINQAYCAVASVSAILNSLRFHHNFDMAVDRIYSPYPYSTQHDIFFSCTNQNVILETNHHDGVLTPPYGLSLDQASLLLECHVNRDINGGNWSVTARHVDPDEWTVDAMRDEMIEILNSENGRVAINYNRATLGQVGGGHFSPIGAYDPETDSFLILDVAKYKYPPVWAPATHLFDAIATIDTCGTWDYPYSQKKVKKSTPSAKAKEILGCQDKYRGYLTVKKLD